MSALAPSPRFNSFKFDKPGAKIRGRISQPPRDSQVTDFTTRQPKFWPDGQPVMQTQLILATDAGEFAVYAKGQLASAIRDALREANASDVEMGGLLEVEFTEYGKAKAGGQPPKLYSAQYEAPSVSDDDDEQPPF